MELPFDLDAEVVKLIKSKSIELPTYPGVALQLQRLINHGDYGLNELAKLVESDQALATNVLRTANSAFYGASKAITTLNPAIARVGVNSLNSIAIAGTLGVQSSTEGPLVALRKDSWRRSLISALLCQQLAPSRELVPGEAFLAGLLHDFGETIAYACFEALLESHPSSRPQDAATWLCEAQRYHLELGMVLATEWNLPDFVVACVMRHHDAELGGTAFPELVSLVAMCDTISTRLAEAAAVGEVVLTGIAGLREADVEPLRAVLEKVPAFLESFEGPTAGAGVAVPSMVAPEAQRAPALGQQVSFQLSVTTRSGKAQYTATQMSRTALRMEGPSPQTERQLVNLELKPGLKVCATVTSCLVTDAGCVIDVKPFAMDLKTHAQWSKFLEPEQARSAA